MTKRNRVLVILLICTAAIVAVFFYPRVPQPSAYHHFADVRTVLGFSNALNVLSNLPFLLVGLAGIWTVSGKKEFPEQLQYFVFFLGVTLTCFGSSYYHSAPSNERLVWDRLPMTLAFMSLVAAVVGERIDSQAGKRLLLPLLLAGVASVFYWRWTESRGVGDLRCYGLVQFLPMLVIPSLILFFPPKYTRTGDLFIAFCFYALAKLFEAKDAAIFSATRGVLSGHTLKHLAAALSAYWILRMVKLRKPVGILRRA